jgi:hypothetical protein
MVKSLTAWRGKFMGTPAAPAADEGLLYFKSDGNLYKKIGSEESAVGGSNGGSVVMGPVGVTYATGWGDLSAGETTKLYYADGVVTMVLACNKASGATAAGELICTLPVGYRPPATLRLFANNANSGRSVTIATDGTVREDTAQSSGLTARVGSTAWTVPPVVSGTGSPSMFDPTVEYLNSYSGGTLANSQTNVLVSTFTPSTAVGAPILGKFRGTVKAVINAWSSQNQEATWYLDYSVDSGSTWTRLDTVTQHNAGQEQKPLGGVLYGHYTLPVNPATVRFRVVGSNGGGGQPTYIGTTSWTGYYFPVSTGSGSQDVPATLLTLTGGWSNYDTTQFGQALYEKVDRRVYLGGNIKAGGTGKANKIATLPAGCRPNRVLVFPANAWSAIADLRVDPDGSIYVWGYDTGGTNGSISLDVVNFVAKQ